MGCCRLRRNLITPTTKSAEHDVPISPGEVVAQALMSQQEWDQVCPPTSPCSSYVVAISCNLCSPPARYPAQRLELTSLLIDPAFLLQSVTRSAADAALLLHSVTRSAADAALLRQSVTRSAAEPAAALRFQAFFQSQSAVGTSAKVDHSSSIQQSRVKTCTQTHACDEHAQKILHRCIEWHQQSASVTCRP